MLLRCLTVIKIRNRLAGDASATLAFAICLIVSRSCLIYLHTYRVHTKIRLHAGPWTKRRGKDMCRQLSKDLWKVRNPACLIIIWLRIFSVRVPFLLFFTMCCSWKHLYTHQQMETCVQTQTAFRSHVWFVVIRLMPVYDPNCREQMGVCEAWSSCRGVRDERCLYWHLQHCRHTHTHTVTHTRLPLNALGV